MHSRFFGTGTAPVQEESHVVLLQLSFRLMMCLLVSSRSSDPPNSVLAAIRILRWCRAWGKKLAESHKKEHQPRFAFGRKLPNKTVTDVDAFRQQNLFWLTKSATFISGSWRVIYYLRNVFHIRYHRLNRRLKVAWESRLVCVDKSCTVKQKSVNLHNIDVHEFLVALVRNQRRGPLSDVAFQRNNGVEVPTATNNLRPSFLWDALSYFV
jgi:hypothetical protein